MQNWRNNPSPEKLRVKNNEVIMACQHTFDSLFDQEFPNEETGEMPLPVRSLVAYKLKSSLTHEIKPQYRWYVACNVCDTPDTLEELFEVLYPTLGELRISKRIRPLFDDWYLGKRPLVLNVDELIRTHGFGTDPAIGSLVYYCDAALQEPFVYVLEFDGADELDEMEFAAEGIEAPDSLVICPNCYVNAELEDLEALEDKRWSRADARRLSHQIKIYKKLSDLSEYADARNTPTEPDENDLILGCPHTTGDEPVFTNTFYVEDTLDVMHDYPGEGLIVLSWIYACDDCVEEAGGDPRELQDRLSTTGHYFLWDDETEEDEDDF